MKNDKVDLKRSILTHISLSFLLFLITFFHPTLTVDANTVEVGDRENETEQIAYTENVAVNAQPSIHASKDVNELKPISRDDVKIIPGGQSIGVQLQTIGALVVGHHSIQGKQGVLSPGEDAKVQIGDMIVEINGNPIKKMNEIKQYVNAAGKANETLHVKLKRGKNTIETSLQPVLDERDEEYKIGLYIRDSAAGIGTMTFYEPESKRYGALGHIISDIDTKKPIDMLNGTIVRSSVVDIDKGDQGIPGEKHARFSVDRNRLGSIIKNTPHGIFGILDEEITNGEYDEPMPVSRVDEVEEGPAKILTVVDNEEVEAFDVEIVSSVPQEKADVKGMVIKITDEKLLEATGGIVQGMSGSPIIQNDKIIGAVTHVFVNDPTSGYGVHIEWMLEDAGIQLTEAKKEAS